MDRLRAPIPIPLSVLVSFVCAVSGSADYPVTPLPDDASLIDHSFLLDPPAGKHGFVRDTRDGHFVFDDETPARFFGINVARDSIFQPRPVVDRMIGVFARAGFNLVRFHHMDERDGLIATARPDSRHLREDRLQLLDYWLAGLQRRGIYAYMDLLDYRTFKSADGVRNAGALARGAKPMAVFDARLIELQKEYARALLGRVNSITGVRYADDPTIALLELFDENGLFRKRDWSEMPEPYRAELRTRWHSWLRSRKLRPAPLPNLSEPDKFPLSLEAARFARQIHRKHFASLRDALRALGVRAPLTAVGRYEELPDLRAVAEELDFVGANFYWDHPFWPRGSEWKLPSLLRDDNPISDLSQRSFASQLALSRVRGKPLVLREWNYCWPNRFRAAGMLEAAAYAALHDIDALILFDYRAHDAGDPSGAHYFDVSRDPARWRLVSLIARTFLQRQVLASKTVHVLAHSDAESHRMMTASRRLTGATFQRRVVNDFAGSGAVLPTLGVASQLRSDTNELHRYPAQGYLQIAADRLVARAGRLSEGDNALGAMTWKRLPALGVVAASSLDGRPLGETGQFTIHMVTDASNTGQRVTPQNGRWMLSLLGKLPVIAGGEPAAEPMEIERNGQLLLRVWLEGGALELAISDRKWYLQCQPAGGEVELGKAPLSLSALIGGQHRPLPTSARFCYPREARWVEATMPSP